MLARSIPSILPDLTFEEALEITKLHSVVGALKGESGIITQRPFRAPHHSSSTVSLVGGGDARDAGRDQSCALWRAVHG
jgi:magnesium chelatase family protein